MIGLKVGIKYCGGCNPKYERTDLVTKLKEMSRKDIHFENVKDDEKYDVLLVVGGCSSNCAEYMKYNYNDKVIFAFDKDHLEKVAKELNDL